MDTTTNIAINIVIIIIIVTITIMIVTLILYCTLVINTGVQNEADNN